MPPLSQTLLRYYSSVRSRLFSASGILPVLLHRWAYPFMRGKEHKCTQLTLRCESNKKGPSYLYHRIGGATPTCCATHLTELLSWVTGVFDDHSIPYFALWGTHLGALRHRGIIPWDTDIDLGVETKFTRKITSLLKTMAPSHGYYLECSENLIRLFYSRRNTLHIDIELWEPTETGTIIFKENGTVFEIRLGAIFPCVEVPFYNFSIKTPRETKYLVQYYGENLFTHGLKKYSVLSKKHFVLKDHAPANIAHIR